MKLFFSAIVLIGMTSCTKSQLKTEEAAKGLGCISSTKATVKKEMLNESGSEFFYYLETDINISGSTHVFPDLIPSNLKVEGKRLDIKYSPTEQVHTYVACIAGHVYDPNNPDYKSIPKIQVCNAAPVL